MARRSLSARDREKCFDENNRSKAQISLAEAPDERMEDPMTPDRIHEHIDRIERRLDCIGGIFAGLATHDHWPIDPLEYAAVARRLEAAAAIARQHIKAFENRDLWKAEAEANIEAVIRRAV